jgi:hypothetical protein
MSQAQRQGKSSHTDSIVIDQLLGFLLGGFHWS